MSRRGEESSHMPGIESVHPGEGEGLAKTFSAERKVNVGFAVALVCMALVCVASHLSMVQLNENARSVDHTHEVLGQLQTLLAAVTRAETAERGYVITDDGDYLERYRRSVEDAQATQDRLLQLTSDN